MMFFLFYQNFDFQIVLVKLTINTYISQTSYYEKGFKNNPVYFWFKSKIIQQNKLHHNYSC
jgi:hypothetical protein